MGWGDMVMMAHGLLHWAVSDIRCSIVSCEISFSFVVDEVHAPAVEEQNNL